MKQCTKCGVDKPEDQFHWQAGRKKRRGHCKACQRERDLERKRLGGEEFRQKRKVSAAKYARSSKGKTTVRRKNKQYRTNDPVRARAHWMADRHVPIKGLCHDCGLVDAEERHHEDYSKPLEVDLLCKACHCKRHGTKVCLLEQSSDRNK